MPVSEVGSVEFAGQTLSKGFRGRDSGFEVRKAESRAYFDKEFLASKGKSRMRQSITVTDLPGTYEAIDEP
jgi:hypothetical protein